MKLELQRERVHLLWPEMMPILDAGFREFDPMQDLPLDIDRDVYEALEEGESLRIYTARLDGELVGYAVFVVMRPPRRRYLTLAQQDVVHVIHPHRTRVTKRLISFSERALADEGVKLVYHSSSMGSRFGRLLELMGYRPIAQLHAKVLF